jgi:alpha-methylacyl-CoA racemase
MAPLDGINLVEFGSMGPGPFAATVLADFGATIIRLQRRVPGDAVQIHGSSSDRRGRPAIDIDLKNPADHALALRLLSRADGLIEGFRPGVMERLGLGPDVVHDHNPRLVYGRITGYGQTGPMAHVPGHDINYLALSGVLSAIGRHGQAPMAPVNLLGDYGGGGMLIVTGMLAALLEAQRTGIGSVVDAAMIDGVAQLASIIFSFRNAGSWGERGTNVLDGGAPFYNVYETSDNKFVAIGAIEPQFHSCLLSSLNISPESMPQWDRSQWPQQHQRLAAIFRTKTRDDWAAQLEHTNACATPVLDLSEAAGHPHHRARSTFVSTDHGLLPAPAPRFHGPTHAEPTVRALDDALRQFGFDESDIIARRSRSGMADDLDPSGETSTATGVDWLRPRRSAPPREPGVAAPPGAQ